MLLQVAVCLLVCFSWTSCAVPRIVVDVTSWSPGQLYHFWTITGLCPPAPHKSLLSTDYMMNLLLISALPQRAISHVRIHWLLELVSFRLEDSGVHYNWTHLDTLLDWMHGHNLFPGFELMGNPSNFFTDFDNNTQLNQWHHLVSNLADRYIGRYGEENVSLWRFETWNEPDLRGYNTIPFSLTGYLRYWIASALALKKNRQYQLRIGGPAGLFKNRKKHPLCWGFLDYCARTYCPVDFLSFHKKGNRSGAAILRQGLQLVRKIHRHYPQLWGVKLANDEADPLTGWSHSEAWRADVRYGAMVAHVIAQHQQVMVRKLRLPLEVISNDNGFLNYHPYYFSQRTLLARFQMNNTDPPHIQFFRKPVYVTMGLLSFLEHTELRVSMRNWQDRRLAVLAAMDEAPHGGWTAGVVLSFSADTEEYPGTFFNFSLVVKHILSGNVSDALYTVWQLDNDHTNPSRVWQQAGAPVFPNRTLRQKMRASEGPYRLVSLSAVPPSGRLRVPLSLPLPAVVLLHVCRRAASPPGPVTRLEVFNVTFDEVLLKWDDSFVETRCIKTYEVQFSPSHAAGPDQFRRVNVEDIIFLSFQYVATQEGGWSEAVRGVYRVRAVDYWGRPGKFSPQVRYPQED